jgi:hypothetical protein
MQSQLCTRAMGDKTLKTKEKQMATTTEKTANKENRNRDELTAMLEALETKTVAELQELYHEFEGKTVTTRNKPFLIKKLSAAIREQLDQLKNEEAEMMNSENTANSTTVSSATKPRRQRNRDPRLPPSGTVLSREYKGARHEVLVLDDGFTYNGEHFGSLSKIAKHIADGTSWNGFLFFRNALLLASENQ